MICPLRLEFAGAIYNILERSKIIETRQIIELLNKKRELKTLEQNLGIY